MVQRDCRRRCWRSGPKARDFCNYKDSNGTQASSFFLVGFRGKKATKRMVGTLRLVINKINQSGAAISSVLLDWIIVFL